jgi:hypothetical protein
VNKTTDVDFACYGGKDEGGAAFLKEVHSSFASFGELIKFCDFALKIWGHFGLPLFDGEHSQTL